MIHFLCCLVANYAHIKDGIKLRDYEEAIKEELEIRCELASNLPSKIESIDIQFKKITSQY